MDCCCCESTCPRLACTLQVLNGCNTHSAAICTSTCTPEVVELKTQQPHQPLQQRMHSHSPHKIAACQLQQANGSAARSPATCMLLCRDTFKCPDDVLQARCVRMTPHQKPCYSLCIAPKYHFEILKVYGFESVQRQSHAQRKVTFPGTAESNGYAVDQPQTH